MSSLTVQNNLKSANYSNKIYKRYGESGKSTHVKHYTVYRKRKSSMGFVLIALTYVYCISQLSVDFSVKNAGLGIRSFAHLLISLKSNERL